MQEIIMTILKNGSASEAEGNRIDELEDLLHEQKCYKEIDHAEHDYQGEEIAGLFFSNQYMEAIDKMCECEITPDDFFGFIEYHDEDEEFTEMFTDLFIADVTKAYQSKCKS
jgi:diacylglycerol kinase family enzyme